MATCKECRSNNIVLDTLKSGDKVKACLDCGIVVATKPKTLMKEQPSEGIKHLMGMDRQTYKRSHGAIRNK